MNTKQRLTKKVRDLASADVGNSAWASELKEQVSSSSEQEFGLLVVADAILEAARIDRQNEIDETYKNAEQAMSKKDYVRAQLLFESLGDYSDAQERAADAALKESDRLEQEQKQREREKEERRKAAYQEAQNMFEQAFRTEKRGDFFSSDWRGDYSKLKSNPYAERNKLLGQAERKFRSLDGYRDSTKKLEAISREVKRQRAEEQKEKETREEEKKEKEKAAALNKVRSRINRSACDAVIETLGSSKFSVVPISAIRTLNKQIDSQIGSKQDELIKLDKRIMALRYERGAAGFFELGRKSGIDAELSRLSAQADSLRNSINRINADTSKIKCIWNMIRLNPDEETAIVALVPPTHQMRFSETDQGATWKSSRVREWLNGEFYQSLPAYVRNAIVPTKRAVEHKGGTDRYGNYTPNYKDKSRKEDEVEDKVFIPSSLSTVAKCLHEFAAPRKDHDSQWYYSNNWVHLKGKIWLASMTENDRVLAINLDGRHEEVVSHYVDGGKSTSSKWPVIALHPTEEYGLVMPLMCVNYKKLNVDWSRHLYRPNTWDMEKAGWTKGDAIREVDAIMSGFSR